MWQNLEEPCPFLSLCLLRQNPQLVAAFLSSPPHPHLSTLGRHTKMQGNFTGLSSNFTFSKKPFLKCSSRKSWQLSAGSQVCSLGFICWAMSPLKAGSTSYLSIPTAASHQPHTCPYAALSLMKKNVRSTAGSTRMRTSNYGCPCSSVGLGLV